jgi:cell wall-associated NlpC family hydrolase
MLEDGSQAAVRGVVGVRRRSRRIVRGSVPVALAALLGPLLGVQASAQPTTAAGLLAHYYDLSKEAEKVNEELLQIQEQLAAKRAESAEALAKANETKAAAELAHSRAESARLDMDRVTALLSGRPGRRGLSALVAGASSDDVLSQVEAASLARQVTGKTVEYGGNAIAEADRAAADAVLAQEKAAAAEAEVAAGAGEVEQRKGDLDRQIAEVRSALDRLTPEQRSLLSTSEFDRSDITIPAGDVGAVLRFALQQVGKPYIWGAVGPASYDCSGLVQTSFRVGGVLLPRVSIQQSGVGQQVLRHDVRPGDLIFYYNPVHHVAIAVDNLRAVHAPSFGETVKIASIDRIGPITVIRRVMK